MFLMVKIIRKTVDTVFQKLGNGDVCGNRAHLDKTDLLSSCRISYI